MVQRCYLIRSKLSFLSDDPTPSRACRSCRHNQLLSEFHSVSSQNNVTLFFSALSGNVKGVKLLDWTDDMPKEFYEAMRALAEAMLHTHPHMGAPTTLTTDASDEAMGVVLQQRIQRERCYWPFSVHSCVLQRKCIVTRGNSDHRVIRTIDHVISAGSSPNYPEGVDELKTLARVFCIATHSVSSFIGPYI